MTDKMKETAFPDGGSEYDELMDKQEEKGRYILKLKKPIDFEGVKYTEIDLSGMEDLTARDVSKITKLLRLTDDAPSEVGIETSLDFACYYAAKAAKLPIEFMYKLDSRDSIRLKNRVVNFLYR